MATNKVFYLVGETYNFIAESKNEAGEYVDLQNTPDEPVVEMSLINRQKIADATVSYERIGVGQYKITATIPNVADPLIVLEFKGKDAAGKDKRATFDLYTRWS